jgi:hypothetical protein
MTINVQSTVLGVGVEWTVFLVSMLDGFNIAQAMGLL